MKASVIIPTYNRPDQLARLLESLATQSLGVEAYEVIVVDDGSTTSYAPVVERPWPFRLRFLSQENAGEAVARNLGVSLAEGEFIVFLDDDMVVIPEYLEALYLEHLEHPTALLLGTMLVPEQADGTVFQRTSAMNSAPGPAGIVPFTSVAAGVLSLGRDVYQSLGGMQPFSDRKRGGWMDLAFAYHANMAGHEFRRCARAIAYHHDYTVASRQAGAQRMYRVSTLAPSMFSQMPGLKPHVDMFRDKGPVDLQFDPPRLVARKMARSVLSSSLSLRSMEALCGVLEVHYPNPDLLTPLYRWIMGAYIYRGYRRGLKELNGQH
jgi:glycosyltransferase involved in cell wall biosynthesis